MHQLWASLLVYDIKQIKGGSWAAQLEFSLHERTQDDGGAAAMAAGHRKGWEIRRKAADIKLGKKQKWICFFY
ncbi:RNA-binding ASCH domain protein [Perilla frutescens var. hirtella]|nr:RNA-binding ASCH domain protein [Perilla frutescens var. hirtella]